MVVIIIIREGSYLLLLLRSSSRKDERRDGGEILFGKQTYFSSAGALNVQLAGSGSLADRPPWAVGLLLARWKKQRPSCVLLLLGIGACVHDWFTVTQTNKEYDGIYKPISLQWKFILCITFLNNLA